MRKSNNDSGLTAKRSNRLLAAGLTVLTVFVVSCASLPPLDDAYFWPDKKAQATQTAQTATPVPTVNSQQPTQTTSTAKANANASPSMEIISQKDTTITVRIKK